MSYAPRIHLTLGMIKLQNSNYQSFSRITRLFKWSKTVLDCVHNVIQQTNKVESNSRISNIPEAIIRESLQHPSKHT
jgi:hypothetical protein